MGATDKLKEQTGLIKKPTTIHQLLESLKPQIALALPRHLQPERMLRIALTAIRTNPKLMECDPQSILASVMLASQLGLEPGVMGQCFLVPYGGVCQLIPGWQGLLDLVNRAGKATAWTGAVYAGDEFDWELGDNPHISHRPCGDEEVLTHVYAVARVNNSNWPVIEVWPQKKVFFHRNKYNKVGNKHYSFNNFEMYARKVALLQALKYIPRSIELATAYSLDASAEMGQQKLQIQDVKGIVEGTIQLDASEGEPVTEQHESVPEINTEQTETEPNKSVPESQSARADEIPIKAAETIEVTVSKVTPKTKELTAKQREENTKRKEDAQHQPQLWYSVTCQDGTKLSVWDTHLHQTILKSTKKRCKFSIEKNDKGFVNVVDILAVDGVPFARDPETKECMPAELLKMTNDAINRVNAGQTAVAPNPNVIEGGGDVLAFKSTSDSGAPLKAASGAPYVKIVLNFLSDDSTHDPHNTFVCTKPSLFPALEMSPQESIVFLYSKKQDAKHVIWQMIEDVKRIGDREFKDGKPI